MVYNKKHMKPRVGSVWSRVGQSKIRYTSGKDFYLQNMALQKSIWNMIKKRISGNEM